ncbi:hypothetical protein CTO_0998 [Chlamydia trachomatis A2497]|uniref:Uncharacterized protein n=1 Tax=Chlamydia trachomatis serovar A (strain A2497) TaxID=580047 RepID=G4NN46_CHLT4|nr:hypothetical protein CTO_0998 [Chlamydia trachomatis A2497]
MYASSLGWLILFVSYFYTNIFETLFVLCIEKIL